MILKNLLKESAFKPLLTNVLSGIFRGTGGSVILEPPVIDALYYQDPDAPAIALFYEDPDAPAIGSIKFEFNSEEG